MTNKPTQSNRSRRGLLLALAGGLVLAAGLNGAHAAGKAHKIAVQVDQNDPAVMNLVLNNAKNMTEQFAAQGDTTVIEIVAYGPGLHMLRADTSPVRQRISAMALELPNVTFSACAHTLAGMTKAEGKAISLISEAHLVPSGAVRLIELQEQGYAYLRP